MGFRIKTPRAKRKHRSEGELGVELADFINFAAGFLNEKNEAVHYAMLGYFTLRLRDGMLFCGYTYNGMTTYVGTKGPPTADKIATLIGDSYFRVHPRIPGLGTV